MRTTATSPHSSTGPKIRSRRDRQSSAGTVSAAVVSGQATAMFKRPRTAGQRDDENEETAAATAGTHHHASRPPNRRPSAPLSQTVGRTRTTDSTPATAVPNTASTGRKKTNITEPPPRSAIPA